MLRQTLLPMATDTQVLYNLLIVGCAVSGNVVIWAELLESAADIAFHPEMANTTTGATALANSGSQSAGILTWLGSHTEAQPPVAFALLMIDFVQRHRVLNESIQGAVTRNLDVLALTFMFLVVVIYIYAVLGFAFFRVDYAERACIGSVWQCFLFHLDHGLRAGGGVGEHLSHQSYGGEHFASRLLFDLSFFLFVIVVIIAIVSGIIIDAFGELRDEKNSVMDNQQNRCFICDTDSVSFERQSVSFAEHVNREHNMWCVSKPISKLDGCTAALLSKHWTAMRTAMQSVNQLCKS